MEFQDAPNQEQDVLADKVMDSIGVDESGAEGHEESSASDNAPSKESLSVQKRLKAQKRAHGREVRELQARIGDLESRMSQPSYEQTSNAYEAPQGGSVEDHIQRAVTHALNLKDQEERKQREAQSQAHVQKQYQEFQHHLDKVGDKYDDFHDVVFGRDTPYTPSMRDYAVTLPRSGPGSAGEVLYKLGLEENRPELERIAKLHPLDQAREMAKLSHALISGGEQKSSRTNAPLGQIKSNPVTNSHAVSDKTPVSSIRQRMKSGSWK